MVVVRKQETRFPPSKKIYVKSWPTPQICLISWQSILQLRRCSIFLQEPLSGKKNLQLLPAIHHFAHMKSYHLVHDVFKLPFSPKYILISGILNSFNCKSNSIGDCRRHLYFLIGRSRRTTELLAPWACEIPFCWIVVSNCSCFSCYNASNLQVLAQGSCGATQTSLPYCGRECQTNEHPHGRLLTVRNKLSSL